MSNNQCDIDHLLRLTVQNRKLEGVLTVSPPERIDVIDEPTLIAYLEGAEVHPRAIDKDAIRSLLKQLDEHPGKTAQAIVARGTEPVRGTDASITFDPSIQLELNRIRARKAAFENAVAKGTLQSDPEGENAINFYTMSPFLIVHKGDPICTITPEVPGKDGSDIYGESIASVDGRDNTNTKDPSLCRRGNSVTAAISGNLIVQPDSIRINSVLEIPRDVDFSTANVDFPSDVDVGGGVLDHFSVRAEGSIEIRKLVQSSAIDSNQSITLHQGMAGKNSGTLAALQNLTAGYLESVHAVVGGDCNIQQEITNSQIQIAGELHAPTAHARGGEISAARGITLGVIGSIQGVETIVVLGELRGVVELVRKTQKYLEQLNKSITAKQNAYERFTQSIGKPTPAQIEEQMGLEFELSELRSKIGKLDAANQKLLANAMTRMTARITVNETIFAKSVLWMPGYKAVFQRDIRGPITITLSSKGEPVVDSAGELRPLREIAKLYPDSRIPRIEQVDGQYRVAA
ncbi:MAG: DUF342 domain-containing protein [Phycisphaerales bacterium]|nr:DUF342 domain-containing protein [Phycisphaerales bacterium]